MGPASGKPPSGGGPGTQPPAVQAKPVRQSKLDPQAASHTSATRPARVPQTVPSPQVVAGAESSQVVEVQ